AGGVDGAPAPELRPGDHRQARPRSLRAARRRPGDRLQPDGARHRRRDDGGGRRLGTGAFVGRSVKGEAWFEKIAAGAVPPGETYSADPAEDRWVAQV